MKRKERMQSDCATTTAAAYEQQQDTNLHDLSPGLWGRIIMWIQTIMEATGDHVRYNAALVHWTRLTLVCHRMRDAFLVMMSDDRQARELLPDLSDTLNKESLVVRACSPSRFVWFRNELRIASFNERYCRLILGTATTSAMELTGYEASFRVPHHLEDRVRCCRQAFADLPLPQKLAAALAFDNLRSALDWSPLPIVELPTEETPQHQLFLYDTTKAETIHRVSTTAAAAAADAALTLNFGEHQSIYVDALRPYRRDTCVPPDHLLLSLRWEPFGRFGEPLTNLHPEVTLDATKDRLAIVTPFFSAVWSHFGLHGGSTLLFRIGIPCWT